MFEVKENEPQWMTVFRLLASTTVDDIITYDEFDAALGFDFRGASRPGLDKATKVLEHKKHRTVEVVRNKGYRVVRAEEHERLAQKHQLRSLRQTKRSQRKVQSANRSELTLEAVKRLDVLELHYAQLAAAQRRNSARIEQVDVESKFRDRQQKAQTAENAGKLDLLASQIARLQARIDQDDSSRSLK